VDGTESSREIGLKGVLRFRYKEEGIWKKCLACQNLSRILAVHAQVKFWGLCGLYVYAVIYVTHGSCKKVGICGIHGIPGFWTAASNSGDQNETIM